MIFKTISKSSSLINLCTTLLIQNKVHLGNYINTLNINMLKYVFYYSSLLKKNITKINNKTLFNYKKFTYDNIYNKILSYNQINLKKSNIIILDLIQTIKLLKLAGSLLKNAKKYNKNILFICTETKDNFNHYIEILAKNSNSFFITNKWFNGLFTNWYTTTKLLTTLKNLEKQTNLSKKDKSKLIYLNKLFRGIKHLTKKPDIIIYTHQVKDILSIKETFQIGIPTIGLVDINNNPNLFTYPIPTNIDSTESIKFILNYLNKKIIN